MRVAIVIIAIGALPGCFRYFDFRSETRPVSPEAPLGAEVEGSACTFNLFHAIPFSSSPGLKARSAAYDAARQQPLVDVVIEEEWIYAVVGDVRCVTFRGLPVKPPPPPAEAAPPQSAAPEPVPAVVTKEEPMDPELGPQMVTLGEAGGSPEDVARLRSWLGSEVLVTFKSDRQARGRLVEVSGDSLKVLPKGGTKSWSAPLHVMASVRREAQAEDAAAYAPPEPAVEKPVPPPEPLPTDVDLSIPEGREAAEQQLARLIGQVVRVDRRVGPPVVGTLIQVNRSRLLVKTADGMVQIGNATRVRSDSFR